MYPDGLVTRENKMPVVDLAPSPAYEKITEACGGYGEKVEDPTKLVGALERALEKVDGGQQVTLNIITRPRAG